MPTEKEIRELKKCDIVILNNRKKYLVTFCGSNPVTFRAINIGLLTTRYKKEKVFLCSDIKTIKKATYDIPEIPIATDEEIEWLKNTEDGADCDGCSICPHNECMVDKNNDLKKSLLTKLELYNKSRIGQEDIKKRGGKK